MKILLVSRYFPPEIGTAANLFFELAKALVQAGHSPTVVTGFPWYNLQRIPGKYKNRVYMVENIEGIKIIRISSPLFGSNKMRLALGHATAPLASFMAGLFAEKPEIIFVYSPPLFMGISGWLLHVVKRAPFVMGVQDLHPQCYIDQGVLKNPVAIYLLRLIEKFCYKKASIITVHSEGNRDYVINKVGINGVKVKVLPNWIDTEEMSPLPRRNYFSEKYNLNDKFVVGYAGTLSISQGLMSIIAAADILKRRKDIEFFIVGDGIEKDKMIAKVKELGLNNVRFLEMQPKSVYPYVVASCDVGLVTLNQKVKTPVVPSKILSTMAAARPVLASLPLDGDAPRLIKEAGCGICIEAENPVQLAGKTVYLAENRDIASKMALAGREYVVKHFSLSRMGEEIEKIFAELMRIDNERS